MRSLLPVVALCALSSVPLRADMFDIKLTGNPGSPLSGSGTFSADGICTTCLPGAGLLSLTINIGSDSGMNAFDLSDDGLRALYQRPPAKTLSYIGTNSETSDILDMELNIWSLLEAGTGSTLGFGTYSVTPAAAVPEPSSLVLITVVALVGERLRRWRRQH